VNLRFPCIYYETVSDKSSAPRLGVFTGVLDNAEEAVITANTVIVYTKAIMASIKPCYY